jgi:hypothetical protein
VEVNWSTGQQDIYPPLNNDFLYSLRTGDRHIDTTQYVWLVMALIGATQPVLMMEKDAASFDTLMPGTYARLARINGPHINPIPQA